MADNVRGVRLPWSDWTAVRVIGRGAYGVVYEAVRDISGTKERAAVKVVSFPRNRDEIDSDLTDGYDMQSIRRKYADKLRNYENEYKLMLQLRGQTNIVNCDDFAALPHADGIGYDVFIRMELLTPLTQVMKTRQLSEAEIIKIGKDISRALMLCESIHVIHRDIKPDNIMISPFGDYKLGDFDIARTMDHATNATMAGTERYMAPEVIRQEPYGKEVDIYSLGLVLYWMLNNRKIPFIAADTLPNADQMNMAQLRRVRGEPLPPPRDGSPALKNIVLKACAFRPEERFSTAEEMYRALDAVSRGGAYTAGNRRNPSNAAPNQQAAYRAGSQPAAYGTSQGTAGAISWLQTQGYNANGKKNGKSRRTLRILIGIAVSIAAIVIGRLIGAAIVGNHEGNAGGTAGGNAGTNSYVSNGSEDVPYNEYFGLYDLYFVDQADWNSQVYCYMYASDDTSVENEGWPGETMTELGTLDGHIVFGYDFPRELRDYSEFRVTFSDGAALGNQFPLSNGLKVDYVEGENSSFVFKCDKKTTETALERNSHAFVTSDDWDEMSFNYYFGSHDLYAVNMENWQEPLYCYMYVPGNSSENNGAWPGAKMTLLGTINGYSIYGYDVPDSLSDESLKYLFSDGIDGGNQQPLAEGDQDGYDWSPGDRGVRTYIR